MLVCLYCLDTGKLIFNNVVETINEQTKLLRADGCHIIIGVGHYGYQEDMDMANLVDLDLIIGGHSHTLLWNDGPMYPGLDQK